MRIAFDVAYIQDSRAGLGRFAAEILRSVLAFRMEEEFLLHGWSFSLDMEEIRKLGGTSVEYSLRKIPGFVKREYWNRLSYPAIETIVGKCDIFHSMDPFLPPLRGARGIVTVHDLAQRRYPGFFDRSVLKWEKHIQQSLERAAAIFVPSSQTRNDLLEAYHLDDGLIHRVHVPFNQVFRPDPNPETDERTRLKYGISYPFVLFVGTLEPRKNIIRLIQAFQLVAEASSLPLHLLLAGKRGWMYQGIIHAIQSSAVRDKINILEYVSDSELACLYRQASVFVYPSLYEGHGLPVIEAMASGLPVVTSNSSSLRELGSEAAELVDPERVEDIAGAIASLLSDDSKRARYIASGLERARLFTHSVAANEVLSVYRAV
jgi:glycosyltransferase involved in cell wall biosynthesis